MKGFFVLIFASVLMVSCCLAQGGTKNIYDMLMDNKDRFSMLLHAIDANGLKDTLQTGINCIYRQIA